MKFITKVSALFLLLFGVYGQALAIPVISGDGTETCVSGTPLGGASCAITLIDDHNLWKQNGDADLNGAVW
ncbi:MAG: hypothetical protein PVG94_06305, partial [Gammaproteobacteria bacterium]